VPTPDFDDERDDQIEVYLKQFRPLTIETLPRQRISRATAQRSFAIAASVAAALILIAVLFAPRSFLSQRHRMQDVQDIDTVRVEHLANARSLTMLNANALLAASPSLEAAIDELTFQPQGTPLPKDRHSALAVLSEEKIKP
jgi:hypothetical protein